jgi:DNA polymerase III delta prime subunit
MNENKFLWVEKYRPQKIDECILPESLKNTFKQMILGGNVPNLILTGLSGVGKTTVARAMCEETGSDYIILNGSVESGIDTLRVKIMGFATTISLMGGRKVIIVDEADNLTTAAQLGFRGVIEEVSNNCTFIFTCNHLNRIHDSIHSRCAIIDFKLSSNDKTVMATLFLTRIKDILATENVKYDLKVLVELIVKFFPDYRRIINELQRYSVSGSIDIGILSQIADVQIDELVKHMKIKDFKAVRQWVGRNSDKDTNVLMRKIYDGLMTIFKGPSVAMAVILLGKYQYQAAFVADQEINLMAFLTELMVECEFH